MPHEEPKRAFEEAFTQNAKVTGHEEDFRDTIIAEIHSDATQNDLEGATRRLRHNRRILPPQMIGVARILLYFAALASAIWLLVPLSQTFLFTRFFVPGKILDAITEIPRMDEVQDNPARLLLYGDENAEDDPARWHALWMSEPDNPAWFSRYAAMRLREEGALDQELLDEASRIDPENGYWHLIAACVNADDYMESVTIPATEDAARKTEWFATDEDEVLRRIEMIHQAAAMPILESRHLEWYEAAIPKLPPTDGFIQSVHTTAFLAGEILYGGIHVRKSASIQEAAMRIAVERNDAEMAKRIIYDWHRLCLLLTKDATTLIDVLIAHVIASQPVELFYQAARDLNLDREMELLEPILVTAREVERHRAELRRKADGDENTQEVSRQKGSMFSVLTLGQGPQILVNRPDHPREMEMRPSRRMEHAFFDRIVIATMAKLVIICLIIFGIYWLWAGRTRRAFAMQAMMLLPIWKRILFGVLAGAGPLIWYLLITRVTPLGWHEWSLIYGMRKKSSAEPAPRCSTCSARRGVSDLGLANHAKAGITGDMEPITFKPIYMERVWGGRELERVYQRELPNPDAPFGEAWEIVDREEAQSMVEAGPFAGKSLHELWTNHREEIFGAGLPESERFPILLKILDARDDLSIQVHPPAHLAASLGGEPKTEMWVIADCEPGAKLYVGLKRGVDRAAFERAIQDGTVADCVHAIEPMPGESIFIPSGRLHAIGAGFLIHEIQQNSDTTYRVFDWNRTGLDGKPRELHVEPSLASIDFGDFEPGMDARPGPVLAECPYFKTERIELSAGEVADLADPEHFAILSILSGSLLTTSRKHYTPGQSILMPKSCTSLVANSRTTLLRISLPIPVS